MTSKENSKKIILSYGTLLGVISITMSIVLYLSNNHLEQNQSYGIISILFILLAIILGIRKFAKTSALSFGEGLKVGMGIAVLGAVFVTVYNYIFTNYIEPDFINQLAAVQKAAMEKSGELDAQQIAARIEKLKEGANSMIGPAIGIVFQAFLGFVFSAITTVIIGKNQKV